MQNEIKKEKDRFEALFEYASIGIVLTNARGEIEMVNSYLLGQFGYEDRNELLGKPIETLIPRRYDDRHIRHRERYNQHPEPRSMGIGRDLFALRKDGAEFPVEVSLSNYTTVDGAFVIAFVIDITKRKEIEYAVLSHKAQLEERNKHIEELNNDLEEKVMLRTTELQSALQVIEASRDELTSALSKEKDLGELKSRFVSMASHEFRTPLSTILSSASLLAKYVKDDEQDKRDKHIERIKNSVKNLTGILDEFLSIGKIEDGRVELRYTSFNVKEFVTALCTELASLVKSGQQIEYTHTGPEVVELDESLLRNILFNLLSNAIKFSSENNLIRVMTANDPELFELIVADSGIGISEADQQHLFERFFRAANATNIQGTGLGLHIVARYAELMNGVISFESELEKGTTIRIKFVHRQS